MERLVVALRQVAVNPASVTVPRGVSFRLSRLWTAAIPVWADEGVRLSISGKDCRSPSLFFFFPCLPVPEILCQMA
jgi:hypothetical protein